MNSFFLVLFCFSWTLSRSICICIPQCWRRRRRKGGKEGGPGGSKHKHLHFPSCRINRALSQKRKDRSWRMLLGVAAHRCLVGVVCSDLTRWTVGTKTDAFFSPPPFLVFSQKKRKKIHLTRWVGGLICTSKVHEPLTDTHIHLNPPQQWLEPATERAIEAGQKRGKKKGSKIFAQRRSLF